VVSCIGCSPRVWEVDAKLGVRVDSKSGFFAYYTAAPESDVGSIALFVANEDSIVKSKVIRPSTAEAVYPIQLMNIDGIAVRPATLADLVGAEGIGFDRSDPYVELGYFQNLVQEIDARPGAYTENEEEIFPGGPAWGDPNTGMAKHIVDDMADCVQFAAEYGANAIIDVSVVYRDIANTSFGPPGFYIYGRAIVYQDE
jgi:hypothetical protein